MSISQLTWPLFGQLDISDENFEPRPVVPRKSACFSAARLTVNGPPLQVDAGIGIGVREYRL